MALKGTASYPAGGAEFWTSVSARFAENAMVFYEARHGHRLLFIYLFHGHFDAISDKIALPAAPNNAPVRAARSARLPTPSAGKMDKATAYYLFISPHGAHPGRPNWHTVSAVKGFAPVPCRLLSGASIYDTDLVLLFVSFCLPLKRPGLQRAAHHHRHLAQRRRPVCRGARPHRRRSQGLAQGGLGLGVQAALACGRGPVNLHR